MLRRPFRIVLIIGVLAAMSACTREPEETVPGLLQQVPADTPYVFVNSKLFPEGLRERLGNHYAAQFAGQRAMFRRLHEQIDTSGPPAEMAKAVGDLFTVLDAIFVEFEGRDSAEAMRELGFEPITRSVIYGMGPLPALRTEIADATKLNAFLDRIEGRLEGSAVHADHQGQAYRRIDLGPVDVVIAVTEQHLIAGLLADTLFERDLPLLLGSATPEKSLADSGDIQRLIERHGFSGYGEGFIRLDELVAMLLGEGTTRNQEVMRALGAAALPVSGGCMQLAQQLVAGMPRMVVGVTGADDHRLAARGIWESAPGVSAYLQKLAAPVPGVGAPHTGLLAFGMGIDLPQLRNAIAALLRQVEKLGGGCEWVDPEVLQAIMPQLNLALGPMTAGIKGFNLQIDDMTFDPETLEPVDVRAGLLAAVDDPRGVFALGAMFNPGLAALEVPSDGSFVALPQDLGIDQAAPPVKVAIRDRALLLVTGQAPDDLAGQLTEAVAITPSPLLAADYGIYRLVQRFGGLMERAVAKLTEQGEDELAAELREQLDSFRQQAEFFERLRVSVHASAEGLVMDQVMELR